jgi:uncharacterized protein YabE (DUF348 family)
VNLYGTPVNRRVVSETDPLRVSGPVPVERIDDPDMLRGHSYVEESGVPPQETSVHRKVYNANGDLLHDDTWYSAYEGEKRVIKVGTKEPPPPPKETTTEETETTPTTTTPTEPTPTTTTTTTPTQRKRPAPTPPAPTQP